MGSRALGCEIVVTVPALGPGWLPERFRQVCEVAAESGLRTALEFPEIAAEVKDLRSARDLVSAAGCAKGGLIIDAFHFVLGGSKLEDFERMGPG
jgi:sugar phosphate isomerase/epimerase